VTTLHIRFATTNAPESMKRGLLKDRLARARRLFRFYRETTIDVVALQEAGSYARRIDWEVGRRKSLWARANNIVKGRSVGNGAVVRIGRFKSRSLPDVVVGDLHIAVILVTHRRTGFKFKFYAVHRPTRRAENKNLRPVIDGVLREHTKRDEASGIPWVIAGDMNVNPWSLPGDVKLGQHGVDHIRASREFEPNGQIVVNRPLLSDHDFLIADAVVEV
jgi:endonuclease/exonuclease/phosphatase family metal-dependent hydrolase